LNILPLFFANKRSQRPYHLWWLFSLMATNGRCSWYIRLAARYSLTFIWRGIWALINHVMGYKQEGWNKGKIHTHG
jgi:hypothetical protein